MNITLHVQKGKEYVWNVARATAKSEGISLAELAAKAVILYCTRDNVMLK